jgi:outer membrane murein-binding lipoprotein Lpp
MIRMVWAPLACAMALLSGCSSTPSSPKVTQLHQEVSQLNQQMRHLTSQAGAIEIQGQLNSQSTQGAWLVPQANTPVELQTQLGTLRLSLTRPTAEANGARATLTFSATGSQPVPALQARVVWGERDPATGKPLEASSLSQTIEVPAALLPRASVSVPLRLSGFAPSQIGFVRVHDVVGAAPAAPPQ